VEKQGGGGKRGEELDAKGYNSMGVVPWASTRDRQLWKIDLDFFHLWIIP
jgi:hypothetical protein